MKAVASFVMKGRAQAIMAAAVAVVVALLVPPMSIVSAAIVMLATLRQGWREGLLVIAAAAIALAGLGQLLFAMPVPVVLMGMTLWLPAFGFAAIKGMTRSLRITLEGALAGGAVIVAVQYMMIADPIVFWADLLKGILEQQPEIVAQMDHQEVADKLAAWLPGGLGASWFLASALGILLASSWDASLDKRRFADEFEALRFGNWALIATPVVFVLGVAFSDGQPGFIGQLFVLATIVYLLQGLAMIHGLLHIYGAGQHWLFGLYMLLILTFLHSAMVIAVLGYADGWINFRAKAQRRLDNTPND